MYILISFLSLIYLVDLVVLQKFVLDFLYLMSELQACLLQMLLRKSVGFTSGAGGISQYQRKQQKLHQNWRFKLELHPFAAYNVFS